MGLDGELGPLPRLFADVEEPDAGVVSTHGVFGVDAAEVRELDQVLRLAADVGSRVEQEAQVPGRGQEGAHGRAFDARKRPQGEERRGHYGPGGAGAHERVGFTLLLHAQAHHDGRVGLAPDDRRRRVVGRDAVRGVPDPERRGHVVVLGELVTDDGLVPHQDDLDPVGVAERHDGPLDLGSGRQIRPHRVEGYAHGENPGSGPGADTQSTSTSSTGSPL